MVKNSHTPRDNRFRIFAGYPGTHAGYDRGLGSGLRVGADDSGYSRMTKRVTALVAAAPAAATA